MLRWKFPLFRQWNGYSCGAAVFRMVVRHFTGVKVGNREAIELLKCEPNGIHMTRLIRHLRDYGVSVHRTRPTVVNIIRALENGKLVILDDNRTYVDSHVYVVIGYTEKCFWVVDPIKGYPQKRPRQYVTRAAEWCLHVHGQRGEGPECDVSKENSVA